MWHDLAVALCLLLVIEGLLPAISPGSWKRMVLNLSEAPERQIRMAGLVFIFTGAVLLYLVN